jgi:excisionase family DNA binding protein
MPAQVKQIPALTELIQGLVQAFEHHLEVDARGPHARILRMGGREFRLAGIDEAPEALRRGLCESLAEVAAFGFATALTEDSTAGTRLRMDLITALASVEATREPLRGRPSTEDGDELLTTADAAAQLGMSRPYVSMLCDQGKLGAVTRSEGGHRRIRQAAVDAYKKTHVDRPGPAAN